jgi:hypothetical protein
VFHERAESCNAQAESWCGAAMTPKPPKTRSKSNELFRVALGLQVPKLLTKLTVTRDGEKEK